MLRVGGLGLLGISLDGYLRQQARAQAGEGAAPLNKQCIFIWLNGGPSHFETFDPKPDAADAIRGPYGAISSAVPGIQLCELLPTVAQHTDKLTILRSVTHGNAGHESTALLSGFEGGLTGYGSVVSRFRPRQGIMPPFVHIGSRKGNGTVENSNMDRVGSGELGMMYEPMVVRDPTGKQVDFGEFTLTADVSANRFEQRRHLLGSIDAWRAKAEKTPLVAEMDRHYQQAVEMLTSTKVREAFDVSREPAALRQKYGPNFFGQACLMSRRLIEAGTRFVQIKWYDAIAFDAWDVHGAELPGMSRMEQQLCPRFDQGFAALLEDLDQRGLLDSTLVVVAGEFGRTPQINKFGARDHWPFCFSTVLAGAGLPGGTVIGSSDNKGAYPATRPVKPDEFAATVYHALGLDVIQDIQIRPFVKDATPITELFG